MNYPEAGTDRPGSSGEEGIGWRPVVLARPNYVIAAEIAAVG